MDYTGSKVTGRINRITGGSAQRQDNAPYHDARKIEARGPLQGPLIATFFEEIATTPKTSINVPIISLSKFAPKF